MRLPKFLNVRPVLSGPNGRYGTPRHAEFFCELSTRLTQVCADVADSLFRQKGRSNSAATKKWLDISPFIAAIAHIIRVRPQEKMRRVTTRRGVAFVQDKQVAAYRAICLLVGKMMRVKASVPSSAHETVTRAIGVSRPIPAPRLFAQNKKVIETLCGAELLPAAGWLKRRRALATRLGVVFSRAGQGAVLLLVAYSTPVLAQGTIVQSGPVVAFHGPAFFQNGIVGDWGTVTSPFINQLGLFNGVNCPFGISSQTSPGPPTSQYSLFSVCQTNTLTTLKFYGYNGLGAPGLAFDFAGMIYTFPFATSVNANATVTSVTATGSTALGASSQIVAVKTASASAVTIVLPAASSFPACPGTALSCPVITVKDVYGDSATGQITVTTADAINIDGPTSVYTLPFGQQSADFVLLGTSWMVK